MAGEKYVIDGAIIKCSGCPTPSKLIANPKNVLIQGKKICNEQDKTIEPFAGCLFTLGLCSPSLTNWKNPTSNSKKFGGEKALLDDASIMCKIGGKIIFENSAQVVIENTSDSIKTTTDSLVESFKEKIKIEESKIKDAANRKSKIPAKKQGSRKARKIKGEINSSKRNIGKLRKESVRFESKKWVKGIGWIDKALTAKEIYDVASDAIKSDSPLEGAKVVAKGSIKIAGSAVGADFGVVAGVALFSWSGPGMVFGGFVGGIIGAKLGEFAAEKLGDEVVSLAENSGDFFDEAVENTPVDLCPPPNPDGSGVCIVIHGAGNGTPKI